MSATGVQNLEFIEGVTSVAPCGRGDLRGSLPVELHAWHLSKEVK